MVEVKTQLNCMIEYVKVLIVKVLIIRPNTWLCLREVKNHILSCSLNILHVHLYNLQVTCNIIDYLTELRIKKHASQTHKFCFKELYVSYNYTRHVNGEAVI